MTAYLNSDGLKAAMNAALEAKERGRTYIQRMSARTRGPGAHRSVRTMCVYAQRRGLKVTYSHDGGWFVREHALTVEGDPVEVASFKLIALRYLDQEDS